MSESTTIASKDLSFKVFLWNNRRYRIILSVIAVAILVQFIVFKYLYPYVSFIHGDSFSYINAAQQNLQINTYPIGYSKFLRLFNVFSRSDYVLAAFQYLFVQISATFLLFSFFYFYAVEKVTEIVLLCFIVFNPLLLHLANLISSDCYFLSLSFLWLALLLWIIHRPSKTILLMHATVLYIAFTVRYNALIYPFVSLLPFYLSKMALRKKILGVSLYVLLCGFFVVNTGQKFRQLTGHFQFSPFSGWQFANNAMYAYRYVDSAKRKQVPQKFMVLDQMIRKYFDSTRNVRMFPIEDKMASTYYMWSTGLPLMQYKDTLFKNDTSSTQLKKWASMAPFYKEYGKYIIEKYPWYFIQYFIWPNTTKFFAPPVEFLEEYNSGQETVTTTTKDWFEYKTERVRTRMENNEVWILEYYPILSGIANAVMLCTLLCFTLFKGWQYNLARNQGLLLGYTIWVLNAAFTICASSAALRFQSFPIILATILAVLMTESLVKISGSDAADHYHTKNLRGKRTFQNEEVMGSL